MRSSSQSGGIDWVQVRQRLQASERALEEVLSESPERIEAAYRRRAAKLATGRPEQRIPSPVLQAQDGSPALVFSLAQERYAIELSELAEVLPCAACTPVPGAPAEFRGVLSLRGELRAVVDLGRMILAAGNGNGDSGFVLMVRRPGREIGLRVDRIEGLRDVRADGARPPGNYANAIAGESLMLLDVDEVLAKVFSGGETV